MNDRTSDNDSHFARGLTEAFRDQEIPPRPRVLDETARSTEKPPGKRTASQPKPWLISAASLGGVPAIAVLVMLTISIWPDATIETPSQDVSTVDSLVLEYEDARAADEPPENAKPQLKRSAPPALVQELNRWVNDRTYSVEYLSELIVKRMDADADGDAEDKAKAIRAAFKNAGPLSGLKAVRPGLPAAAKWAAGDTDWSFTYTFDLPTLLEDAARFVNGAMGDEIFDPILDGIRDDPDGPQVDLRRDLFAGLTGEVYLVAAMDQSSELMLVIPVDLTTVPVDFLATLCRVEPDLVTQMHHGVEVLVDENQSSSNVFCQFDEFIVVGERELVIAALSRRFPGIR